MLLSIVILALVTLQRVGELVLDHRNTQALRSRGAIETGAEHYPWMIAMQAAWLAGLWLLAWDRPMDPAFLSAFIFIQFLRLWVIGSLGENWTTRVLTVPGETPAKRGLFKVLPHPYYLLLTAEIALLPDVFGLFGYAFFFSLINAGLIALRIRAENEARHLAAAA